MEGLGYRMVSSLYAQSVRRGLCVWMTPHERRRLAVAPRGGDGRASRAPRRMSGGGPAEVAPAGRRRRPTERAGEYSNLFQALYLRTLGSMGEAGLACHVCGVCAAAPPPPLLPTTFRFLPRAARAVTRRGAVRLRCSVERGSVTPTRTRERGAGERAGPRALYWARWARSVLCDVCEVSRV